ncbi:MAG: diguanylate cyclase domain-containing protein [Bacillota bacterium]
MTTALLFVNIYAVLVLMVVFVSFMRNSDLKASQDKTFMVLITLNLLMLVFDSLHVVVEGSQAFPEKVFQFISLLLYIFPLMIAIGWLYMTGFFLGQKPPRNRWITLIVHTPFVLSVAIAVLSLFTGWYFDVGPLNTYERGPLYLLHVAIVYGYLFIAFINILRHRKLLRRDHYYPMLFFAIPPTVVGFIQTAYQDFPYTWAALTLSIVMVYLFVLSIQVNTDYLTGLFNRKEYEQKMRTYFKFAQRNRRFGVILIDLDGFKAINDIYGHKIGDDVLKTFAHLLERTFQDKSDTIARVGGDEFAVLFTLEEDETAEGLKTRFIETMKAFNQQGGFPFEVEASVSALEYDPDEAPDLEMFLKRLDDLLYVHKERSRRS